MSAFRQRWEDRTEFGSELLGDADVFFRRREVRVTGALIDLKRVISTYPYGTGSPFQRARSNGDDTCPLAVMREPG